MALDKPVYQLPLSLEGVEEAIQDDLRLSTEEVLARSEAAMSGLAALRIKDPGTGKEIQPRWWELYRKLLEGGWPWRVAVYIAWAAQPKKYRWPDTQELLATQALGLTSDRAISTWRKRNPAIDNTVGMLQGAIIYDNLADAYDAMIKVATKADYKGHQDRKLMFEMAGVYTPRFSAELRKRGLTVDDLAEMSDDELDMIAAAAGERAPLSPPAAEAASPHFGEHEIGGDGNGEGEQ